MTTSDVVIISVFVLFLIASLVTDDFAKFRAWRRGKYGKAAKGVFRHSKAETGTRTRSKTAQLKNWFTPLTCGLKRTRA